MVSTHEAQRTLDSIAKSPLSGRPLRRFAVEAVSFLPAYRWVGIYALDGTTLTLDEFVGEPTEHTRIPVGQGVCGTAVAEGANQIVTDVTQLENYLSCSANVKSEIVVLIRRDGEVLGQIDADGHEVAAFDESDEFFLSALAVLLAARW